MAGVYPQSLQSISDYCLSFRENRAFFSLLLILLVMLPLSGCGVTGTGAARRVQERKPVYHVVQREDKFQDICRRYGVKQEAVLRLNTMHNPPRLLIGQRLLMGYSYPHAEARAPVAVKSVSQRSVAVDKPPFTAKGYLAWPVAIGHIASSFGPRNGGFHDGIDFAAPTGTPVFASNAGQVVYADNELSGYGNLVIIRGNDRLTTVYGHNDRILVHEGQRVEKGQEIATVGSTGHSSGPHVHFEVRAQDSKGRFVAVDPWPLLTQARDSIHPRYRVNESLTPLLLRIFKF